MSITGIAYLAVYFAGLLIALFGRPAFGLYIYFYAFYAYAPSKWWGQGIPELRWSLIAAVVTLIAIFIHNWEKHDWLKRRDIKLLILLCLFVWIQYFWALNSGLHLEYSILLSKFLLLTYIIQAIVKSTEDLIKVVVVNLIGISYYGWVGLTQHGGGRFENAGTPGMEDGNLLSLHMVPILITASYLLLVKNASKRFLLLPLILIALNGIFLTGSRGGIISIIIAGFFALFYVPSSLKHSFRFYVFLALLAGGLLVGPSLIHRLNTTIDSDGGQVEKSASSRIVFLKAQFEMFKDENSFFGNGHRTTLILSPAYIGEEYLTTGKNSLGASSEARRGSHNLFASILVDHGLIGLTIYILILLRVYSCFKRCKHIFLSNGHDPLIVVYIGLFMGFISINVASLSVNSIKLEIAYWYIALLGISYQLVSSKYLTGNSYNNRPSS